MVRIILSSLSASTQGFEIGPAGERLRPSDRERVERATNKCPGKCDRQIQPGLGKELSGVDHWSGL